MVSLKPTHNKEKNVKKHSETTYCSSSPGQVRFVSPQVSPEPIPVLNGQTKLGEEKPRLSKLYGFCPALLLVECTTFREVKVLVLEGSFFPFYFLENLRKNRKSESHFLFSVCLVKSFLFPAFTPLRHVGTNSRIFYCSALTQLVVLWCHIILNDSATGACFLHVYISFLLCQWSMTFYECIFTSY